MASTSSTTPRRINYDVFLSFRGTDTRKTFVDYLYNQLDQKGIRTFKDDVELEKGQRIEELLQIIKKSQFAIVVFSQDYASAKWCLEEIATIMECQQQYGKGNVIPIFYDVEPSVVRNQTESFAESFKRHEEENTEKAKVKRWKEALKKAGEISGYHLQNHFNGFEAHCVEIVTNDIFTRVNRSIQASSTVLDNFMGIESRLIDVGKLLTQELDDVQFIGIWGMGGVGKTTIAMVVFNKFSSQFDGACFLDDVKEHKITGLQENLLKTILKVEKMEISNEVDGMEKIEKWLGRKKVLIVIDDVDKVKQLEKLAGRRDWFGRGSRVIITTRDAGVLRSHGVDKKYVYELHTLKHQKATQLFSHYAFKCEIPATGFEILSGLIVHYCKGLPLALKILGSSLCGLEAADWESILEELKNTPNDDIDVKLKISFDRLDSKNKKIFLHIACFFRHHYEKHVKEALKGCNLLPAMGLRVLVEKSLISFDKYGRIEMHDLIQEMGWHIARDEKHSSRVWELKEVDDVLCGKMDPKHIEFMLFPYTCGFRWQNISSAFEVLKILIGKRSYNEEEDNNFDYQLPSSLRWLHFPYYPFRSLPTSFHHSSMDTNPSELVGLCLHRSSLENCWITKELNKLTYLDLSYSYSLLETPNFDMMPNLRSLDLSNCSALKEIHPSVGRLEKLVLLDFEYCSRLQTLPCFVQVSSLRFLKLEFCSKLEKFPEIQANMPLVLELNLEHIRIRELPSSIGRLRGLTKLGLCRCNDLVSLSDDLCELESLKILELRDCPKLESLPEKLGNLSKLEELHIIDTAIFQLPSSITQLSSLECLCWGARGNSEFDEERSLKFVPSVSGWRSLKRLQLSDFHTIDEGLPSDLEYLDSLEYLSLRRSNFVDLPESFSQLPRLQYLDIKGCRQLKELPETTRKHEEVPDLPNLPATTRELYTDFRFASRRNITKLLAECPELHAVAFSDDDGYHPLRERAEYFLSRMCIRFQLPRIPRKTPFSVSFSDENFYESPDVNALRYFQYRCYQSNGISIDLTNHSWYSVRFVGFAVYFISSEFDMWGPHSYKDIHCVEHCTVIAKLSHKNNRNEALQTKCVIVNANDDTYEGITEHVCYAYIPFSSLCPESNVTPNNFSRFEVKFMNFKATANWGCSLLYQSRKRVAILEDICSCTTLASRNDICEECEINDKGPLYKLEYMNFSGKRIDDLPGFISSELPLIQYLDISGYKNVEELPKLPSTIKQLYAAYNRNLATEDNIAELATKYSKLSSVSFSYPMHDADTRGFLEPWELAKKFIPITQPFLNRNTPFAVTYPFDEWSDDDYNNIDRCFKYPHNDSNKISISLDPNWYNHNFVGFVVCFQFPEKVRWESHPDIRPFRHCKLITKLTHKDNGTEPLQIECVIGRLYDEEFCDYFEDRELVCFAYIPFSSLWPKSKAITDTTTLNHYLVFEVAFQDLEFSKHFNAEDSKISTDWSCDLLYTDDESLIEELRQKRENGSSDESDSEEEEEEDDEDEDEDEEEEDEEEEEEEDEEEEDGGSQHIKDSGGDDAIMAENRNAGHCVEIAISEHNDSGKEGEDEGRGKSLDAGQGVEVGMSKHIDSERIDDEEASMAEKSVIDAALSGEIHAFTQTSPITGKEIQNYHIEEDYETTTSQHELGPNETKLWESTAIVDRDQCRMVSMPECSDAKVARLLYTNSGVSILALSLDGIQKLWKWPNNEQKPTGKATANSVPQHWQPNSGLLMINDVEGVNLEKVVPCIALSNDGSYIVSATGGKVSLFNIMTFKVMKLITLPSAPTFLAFNPHDDNIIVIGTEKSTIYIYYRIDDDDEEEFNELEEHQKPITGLAFSTNLKLLVSSDADAQLCSWNTRLWKKKRSVRIQLPAGEVCSGDTHVMFHVDQLHLLVTHETQLAIYDASKMERINQWIPHGSLSAPISSATYSCNCELIYASFKDGNIGVFDAHKLRLRCRIAPSAYLSQAVLNRNEGVYAVVIAAHPQEPNQLALGLIDGSVKVIEPLESGGEWGISLPMGHRTKLWEFTKIVDQVQCQVIFMTECSDVKVARLLYTNPGGILALRSNGIQKLWKWPNNEQNPTGKATANSAPEHWQPNSGLMINDVDVNPEEVVSCIDLSKNDSYIVSAAGKKVSLLDIMTFEVLTTFNPPSTPTFLVFCPCDNNIIAIGMEDATIIIYNVRLNKVKIRLIRGHHEPITCLAFSTTCPNMLVSSSADAQLCVWNIVGRRQNRRLVCIRSPDGKVHSGDTHVMFHTDQLHVLLVTRETQLAIYDTSNLERKRQWIPQGCLSTKISSATYSCNSQLVYASFTDGNIGVLDADNLTLRCCIVPSAYLSQPLMNSEDVVHAVVIAAHPQKPNQLAIGLTDGSIKVIEPLEYEGEWGISPPIDIEILNGTGEAEQREPNLANEDCEPEEISARTQVELGTGEAEQSEPNPTNEDCEPEEISVRTQIELGTVEVEQVEPNPANEDCEAAKKSVLTQLEQGTGEAEQTEPNPTNEDCELEERSVVTQPELGTGEAEQSEPNPANEDCEAKVHSNKCALIRCFWKCC